MGSEKSSFIFFHFCYVICIAVPFLVWDICEIFAADIRADAEKDEEWSRRVVTGNPQSILIGGARRRRGKASWYTMNETAPLARKFIAVTGSLMFYGIFPQSKAIFATTDSSTLPRPQSFPTALRYFKLLNK